MSVASISPPPPIIDSARVVCWAAVDDHVAYTNRIQLNVEGEWLGKVERLAIAESYCEPGDFFLLFCDNDWKPQGVICRNSVDEAKTEAEKGYKGISRRWKASTATAADIDTFLRKVYDVDPATQWWRFECSFCGKDATDVEQMIQGESAKICSNCIDEFAKMLATGTDSQN